MIYVSADLHIGRSLKKSCTEISEDSINALKYLSRQIIEDKTDENKSLLLAGDIFDKSYVYGGHLKAFTDFIDDLWKNDIKVYFISGNHDKGHDFPIPASQGAIHIHRKYLEIDDRKVSGIDFSSTEELKKSISLVQEGCNILLLHAPFQHLLPYEGAYQLSLEDIEFCADTVVCGDIHVNDFRKTSGTAYFLSPGSTHPCVIDQGDTHGFYKLGEDQNYSDWSFVEIPSRQILRYKIESIYELEEVEEKLNSFQNKYPEMKPIAEICYTASMTDEVTKMLIRFEKDFILFRKANIAGKVLESKTADLFKGVSKQIPSLDEVLPFCVNPKKDKELFSFMEKLLNSSLPEMFLQEELDRIKNLK